MGNLFQSVKALRPRLNKFNLSHERKMSFNWGYLVPCYLQDVVPGDRFRVSTEIFLRMAPMLAPVMHRVNVYTHYFFVPNRLVWSEWEDFITGGRLGTSAPVAPFATTFNIEAIDGTGATGSLGDFMGLPLMTAPPTENINVSMLPFRAYQLIYDEFYRDQNLTAPVDISTASGEVSGAELSKIFTMRKRAWEKDYFTSALPFAQRGSTVGIPIDDDPSVNTKVYRNDTGAFYPTGAALEVGASGALIGNPSVGGAHIGQEGSTINVNELRRSIRLQEWLERNARGGARYIEQILSHFGVVSSDARLQRPEYLGGGKAPMQISEVLQSVGDGTDPLGNMGGHGVGIGRSNGFKKRFEEHGYVVGLLSVLPRTAYQQGIPRHFTRFDKLDYFWPEFANIGEQEVKNQEVYVDAAGVTQPNPPSGTFGYQSRYAEYKYGCSSVHGTFRTTLDYWHLGRIFSAQPDLNTSFVEADPDYRIFAVEEANVLWGQLYNRVDALRPMPYYGTPTL